MLTIAHLTRVSTDARLLNRGRKVVHPGDLSAVKSKSTGPGMSILKLLLEVPLTVKFPDESCMIDMVLCFA
jgi:hypothetical protein